MARGRKTALTIQLTRRERQTLMVWQRSTTIPAGLARRGRIILLLADGVPLSHIATAVGISRRFVYKWVERFVQDGLDGLADKPGRGRGRTPRSDASRSQEQEHHRTPRPAASSPGMPHAMSDVPPPRGENSHANNGHH